jgi:hypothetical protein
MIPVEHQAIIVVPATTTRIIRISRRLSEYRLCLRNGNRVYVGKLQSRSSICAWWREFHAFDGARIVGRVVGDGEVVEEMVVGIGSVAPIGFDEVGRIVLSSCR